MEEAPFITQKERLMWAVPKEELLNFSRNSGGTKVRLTTNPILEDLDPDIPYPAKLGNWSTGVVMPDEDDIPIMMSDIREAIPSETYEEITARVLERERFRQQEMQASGGYGGRGGGGGGGFGGYRGGFRGRGGRGMWRGGRASSWRGRGAAGGYNYEFPAGGENAGSHGSRGEERGGGEAGGDAHIV